MFSYYFQKIKNIYHYFKALCAVAYYGNPSKDLTVIGVTGTDGKTTTAALIYHILKENGKKVSMISTVAAQIGNTSYDTGFHVTSPSPFVVQKYLKKAVDDGSEFFVLETTSHGLDQYRVYGVNYDFGVITNITHEHLHYHKTYEEYVKAKAKLIQWSKTGIINRDDQSYKLLKSKFKNQKSNIITYGLKNKADYNFDISEKLGIHLAQFNKYNYLAAYIVGSKIGLSDNEIYSAMKTYQLPPGRMEVIYDKDFTVIVDFAHTPNGLHEALGALRHQYKKRRIIHIFGAAAFRDDEKRPIMGRESGEFADLTILTEEDYRTEDPHKICKEIAVGLEEKGFKKVENQKFGNGNKKYTMIINRKEAIAKALEIRKKGDVIVMTGKGHEQSLCRGKKEYPWNDKEETLKLLEKLEIRN